MENSLEDAGQQPVCSPPRRRRSTFFERRQTIVPQENENFDIQNLNSEDIERHREELSRYYSKLLIENDQWKKEVKNRRNVYHDLRQQLQLELQSNDKSRISYASLSPSDIEYLKAKPNLSKLADSQLNLNNSLKETIKLYRRVKELDTVVLEKVRSKVNEVTDYIFEHSAIDTD